MKRTLLALSLVLAVVLVWPAAAQQPFGQNPATVPPIVFTPSGGSSAAATALTLPNNTYMVGTNQAGNATVDLWKINTSNQIESGAAQVNTGPLVATTVTSSAGSITSFGSVVAGNASAFFFSTRALVRSPSDGLLTFNNNAETVKSFVPGGVAPTVSSGFCTSPTITNGPASAFLMDVGSACATGTGIIALPTATNGWHCTVVNLTNNATTHTEQSATTTTTATFVNFVRTTGVAGNWAAGDDLSISCIGR